MTLTRPSLILALALLTACGGAGSARLNPFTWFKPSDNRVALEPREGFADQTETRPLVDQVTEMTVAPVVGGALVQATGLPPVQGYWNADLVSANDMMPVNGVLTLDFRLRPPVGATRVSTPQSREVTVGLFLSTQQLAGVTEIRVVGARNQRVSRR
jgi:hypothetical protein